MRTAPAAPTTATAELDLLQQVAVLVPCSCCGEHYTVSLRDVLMSQDMLHEGCPACHETECLPLTYAALADEASVRAFEHSWIRLSRKVRAAGFDLTFCRPVLSHCRYKVPPPSPHVTRDRILQAIVYGGWTIGVPVLAIGMGAASARLVSGGAWALFVGVALTTLDSVSVVSQALRPRVTGSEHDAMRTVLAESRRTT